MTRLGVHGAVKERLGIPPYGSNPKMPLNVFHQTFRTGGPRLPDRPDKALRGGISGKPRIELTDEDWARAFAPRALEDGECEDCRGRGFTMRPWKEGKITLASKPCRSCKGTGKRSPEPKRQGSKE